jgi:hypothetical protein
LTAGPERAAATLRWFRRRKFDNSLRQMWSRPTGKLVFAMFGFYAAIALLGLLASLGSPHHLASAGRRAGAILPIVGGFDLYLPALAVIFGRAWLSDGRAEYDLLYTSPISFDAVVRERRTFGLGGALVAAALLAVAAAGFSAGAVGVPFGPTTVAFFLLIAPLLASAALLASLLAERTQRMTPARARRVTLGSAVAVVVGAFLAFPSVVVPSIPFLKDPGWVFLWGVGGAQTDWAMGIGSRLSGEIVVGASWVGLAALVLMAFVPRARWSPQRSLTDSPGSSGVEQTPPSGPLARLRRIVSVRFRNRGPDHVAGDLVEVVVLRRPGPVMPLFAAGMILVIGLVLGASGAGQGPGFAALPLAISSLLTSLVGSFGLAVNLRMAGPMLRESPLDRRSVVFGIARIQSYLTMLPVGATLAVILVERLPWFADVAVLAFLGTLLAAGVVVPILMVWRGGVLTPFRSAGRFSAGVVLLGGMIMLGAAEGFGSIIALPSVSWTGFSAYWAGAAVVNGALSAMAFLWLLRTSESPPDFASSPGSAAAG